MVDDEPASKEGNAYPFAAILETGSIDFPRQRKCKRCVLLYYIFKVHYIFTKVYNIFIFEIK